MKKLQKLIHTTKGMKFRKKERQRQRGQEEEKVREKRWRKEGKMERRVKGKEEKKEGRRIERKKDLLGRYISRQIDNVSGSSVENITIILFLQSVTFAPYGGIFLRIAI
jgi:hypothetical protein